MQNIVILSASVRTGRRSHRLALYFSNYISEHKLAVVEIVDLNEWDFPLFNERLKYQDDPSESAKKFSAKIRSADGIIIVTPEYNGGYPASLKNVVDLLYDEWYKKPIGICTVSSGDFGGQQVLVSLQFTLWKMKAWTIPAMFPVPKVQDHFEENGVPLDKESTDKKAAAFMKELQWCMTANMRMKEE
ncbi:MAG: NADPH-dependent FMN reductase [Cytophagaceae bacterium]